MIPHNTKENYVGRKLLTCTLYINLDIQMGLGHKTINLYECFDSLDGVINGSALKGCDNYSRYINH